LEDIRDFWIRSGGGREKYTLKSEHRLLLDIGRGGRMGGRAQIVGWFPIDKSGGWNLFGHC